MNTIGQLGSFKDPYLQREIANIYQCLVQRIQPENMDLQRVAYAIGQAIPLGQLRALEEFLRGEAWGTFLRVRQNADQYGLYVVQDDSVAIRTFPSVGLFSDSSAVETVQIQNTGNGRVLKLIGGNATHEVLKLEIGAGSGRIVDTNVAGCFLTNGGVWTDSCTRARKVFLPLVCPDPVGYLLKLPIRRYRYKGTAEEHYGPTAEEFRSVYRVGEGDGLGAMDLAAVTALAVKCLTKELDKAKRRIDKLERRLAERTGRCLSSRAKAHK